MNIFKLKNNTIICIISRDDLDKRHMKISELAHGTRKGKRLFNEIMKHIEKKYNYTPKETLFMEAQPIDEHKILLAIHEV